MTGGRPAPSDPRLRQRRIEKKPKAVEKAASFSTALIDGDDARTDELIDIIESIERGDGVPEAYYRKDIDTDRDRFLDRYGVIHLHLEHKGSDLLVYLVQYDDRVVLVALGGHDDLSINPPGRVLKALQAGALNRYDRPALKARADAAALEQAAAAAEAAEQAEKKRAALAALKAKIRGDLKGAYAAVEDTGRTPKTSFDIPRSSVTGRFRVPPPKKR